MNAVRSAILKRREVREVNSYLIDFWIRGIDEPDYDNRAKPLKWLRNGEDEEDLRRRVSEECEHEITVVAIEKLPGLIESNMPAVLPESFHYRGRQPVAPLPPKMKWVRR